MADHTDNKNFGGDKGVSSGELLRVHREKLGLTTQEIANSVHLEIKIIEAIEKNEHDKLPAAIYVRGYLRSYAKVVDADAERVIELYNADSLPAAPEILPEVKPPTQASSSDKPVKAFTYLISLGLVLLMLIWYQSNFVVETPDRRNVTPVPTEINGVDTTFEVVIHPQGWQAPDDNQHETAAERAEVLRSNEQLIDTNPAPDTSETTGTDIIKLTVSVDSWIEIYDSNAEKLFHDLARRGEYVITGQAPFNLLFGFSDGVTVEFNGKQFDHTPYSKNNIARFTLPVE